VKKHQSPGFNRTAHKNNVTLSHVEEQGDNSSSWHQLVKMKSHQAIRVGDIPASASLDKFVRCLEVGSEEERSRKPNRTKQSFGRTGRSNDTKHHWHTRCQRKHGLVQTKERNQYAKPVVLCSPHLHPTMVRKSVFSRNLHAAPFGALFLTLSLLVHRPLTTRGTPTVLRAARALATAATTDASHSSSPLPPPPTTPTPSSDPALHRIVDDISALTLLQAADLVTLLKVGGNNSPFIMSKKNKLFDFSQTRLNIQEIALPAAGAAAPSAGAGAAAAEEAVAEEATKPKEKTIFNVKLESFDAGAKPKIIKEVKAIVPNLTLIEVRVHARLPSFRLLSVLSEV
jgi:ribosomal protein L7/L12